VSVQTFFTLWLVFGAAIEYVTHGRHEPPQSTSVSFPSLIPSAHVSPPSPPPEELVDALPLDELLDPPLDEVDAAVPLEEFEEPFDDDVPPVAEVPLPDEEPLEEAVVPLEAEPPAPASAPVSVPVDEVLLHARTRVRPTKAIVPSDADAKEERIFTARRLSPQQADRPHPAILLECSNGIRLSPQGELQSSVRWNFPTKML
jgi:hypothetical protein